MERRLHVEENIVTPEKATKKNVFFAKSIERLLSQIELPSAREEVSEYAELYLRGLLGELSEDEAERLENLDAMSAYDKVSQIMDVVVRIECAALDYKDNIDKRRLYT